YIWGRGYNSISVILDWTNTGEAPEVKACDIHSEQTTTSNAFRYWQSHLLIIGLVCLAYR
ncbi:unnamed protein product, partial [Hymenolepis diminuta]